MSKKGDLEVITDASGKLVTDPEDMGTYNFCPSDHGLKPIAYTGHFILDILPWIFLGNSPKDSTYMLERILASGKGTKLYKYRKGLLICEDD